MKVLSNQEVAAVSGGDVIDAIHVVEVVMVIGAGIAGAAVTGVPIVVGIAATVVAFGVGTGIGMAINALTSNSSSTVSWTPATQDDQGF